MRHATLSAVAAVALFAVAAPARADLANLKVTVAHNTGDAATSAFKFKDVPAPAKAAADSKVKATVVDGDKDENSAEPTQVITGELPTEEDQPDHNFFFSGEGGRLRIDLGSAQPVTMINTYSWHPNTRGPQVYTLYVADGSADTFKAEPKKGTDPVTVGWTKVTMVDTRKNGEAGGQYGVSIAAPDGKPMTTARYVLLDCQKTESDDENGNTFFSHIDVVTTPAAAK